MGYTLPFICNCSHSPWLGLRNFLLPKPPSSTLPLHTDNSLYTLSSSALGDQYCQRHEQRSSPSSPQPLLLGQYAGLQRCGKLLVLRVRFSMSPCLRMSALSVICLLFSSPASPLLSISCDVLRNRATAQYGEPLVWRRQP